jgi:hypothetical protein
MARRADCGKAAGTMASGSGSLQERSADMARKNEAGPRAAATFLGRPLIIALAVILVIAGYILFIEGEPPTAVPDLDPLPTGAGSLPDGAADEQREGLRNETATDDFINDSSQGDLRPEILDPDTGPGPVTDVEDLDPPAQVDDDVLEPGPPDR